MERLKDLRLSARITQKKMADYLKIDRTTYVKYESGKSEPNFATAMRIAEYFGVSIDYLLGYDEYRPNDVNRTFAARLKGLRKNRGITQEQLAREIHVERSSVGKYEGKSGIIPSDEVKKRIAEYFNVSIDYLLGRTEYQNTMDSVCMPSSVGIAIKRIRERLGMSQNQLSKLSGVSQSAISSIESTTKSPSIDTIVDIAKGLNTTAIALLEEASSEHKKNQPAASGSELDEKIISALVDLTPAETLRVLDFVSGIRASRKE